MPNDSTAVADSCVCPPSLTAEADSSVCPQYETNYVMALPADSTSAGGLHLDNDMLTKPGENFFTAKDSTMRTDLPYRAYGIAGDPVPYNVMADNTIIALLLLCFVLFLLSLSQSKEFIAKQLKNFFRHPQEDSDGPETGGEQRLQLFLAALFLLVLSIGSYLVAEDIVGESVMRNVGASLIAIFFAVYAAFFCTKLLVGTFVNTVFFGVKKNLQWTTVQLQVSALDGVLLFPMLALQVYSGFSPSNVAIYVGFVLFLNKILTFYKSYQIFFQGNGLYLQTFLYFCALEIAPLLAFCGAGLAVIDFVKINF